MGLGTLEAGFGDLQGPQVDGIAGAEAAHATVTGGSKELGSRGDVEAGGELAAIRVDVEAGDGEGRDGLQELRVEDVEQLGGDLGKVGVQVPLDAAGEKSEGLDETLDVGVGGLLRLELEARRHFGVALGEEVAHLAQVGQLLPVVAQQLVVMHHGFL